MLGDCDAGPRASGPVALSRGPAILAAQERQMLKWALIFAVIALVAGVFGFTGVAAGAAGIAKFLFFLFIALCVLALILGVTVFKSMK
jgi:uncharacterized membrane protein YtjA (UPF0391 family)